MAVRYGAEIRERPRPTIPQGSRAPAMITRRKALLTLAGAAGTALVGVPALGQGISSRGVKAQPRGKPSGRPFLAHFTDIAKPAGLVHPIVYGGIESKKYIIEVVGSGV